VCLPQLYLGTGIPRYELVHPYTGVPVLSYSIEVWNVKVTVFILLLFASLLY
jgi:hypothetical protein